MTLSSDESRALAFIALVLALAAAARAVAGPERIDATAEPLEPAALAATSDSLLRADERRPRPLAAGETLDPNTASAEELQRLPRIPRALAERIVAERQRGGPFADADDLTRVRGIGPRMAQRLAPFLHFPSTAAGATPRSGVELLPGSVLLGPQHAAAQDESAPPGAPLDLNRATAAELERLPGVGPALAARIIAYRDSAGRFRSVDELDRVRGIGPALLERLRPHVSARP